MGLAPVVAVVLGRGIRLADKRTVNAGASTVASGFHAFEFAVRYK